ncbi:MAG: glycosyltransferase family 39 protein [Acidobacteriia bacterium]|nr:glycosyltransferase family 39 protein [Terriglobia bacterium]
MTTHPPLLPESPRETPPASSLASPRGNLLGTSLALAIYFALAKLILHLLTNGRYGYARDELYFLACGEHLDWGYVDFAPMVALIAKASRALLGDSLHAIRFLPAVAGAAKVLLTGLIARELGGRRFAVALACLSALLAPVYLAIDTPLTMNPFEPLCWMGCAYAVLLAVNREDPKFLLWVGLCSGLGLENKHSMVFFGFALVVGLLLSPQRRFFRNKWIWIAGALALALFLPNLIWEVRHHWPTIEALSNVKQTHKNLDRPPLQFIAQQILMMHPAIILVWGAGLWFFFRPDGKRYRVLGWTFVVLFALMMAIQGKGYYLAPAYPMLLAAGGVLWERLLGDGPRLAWIKFALPALLVLTALPALPFVLPVLPVETLLRYQTALGVRPPLTEVAHTGPLPENLGDMFGWPEMLATVAEVYHRLPPAQRAKTAILAGNYGQAAAVDFFGPRYGLPKAISAHQSYYLWGPRDYTGESMILLQWNRADAERICTSVEDGPRLDPPYAMAEEHFTVLVCRGTKRPLQELWPSLKLWN